MLMAGPLARYIEIKANNSGIKHEMGVEKADRMVLTPTLLKAALGIVEQPEEESEEIKALREEAGPNEITQEQMMGLMSMPQNTGAAPAEEQAEMLGQVEEDPEEELEEEPV
jgi:topoisomerase IA-like protein